MLRSRCPRLAPVATALCLVACAGDAPNPFVPLARTQPVPADARLLFTSDAYTTRAGAPREVYSARGDGGDVRRLTFCNTDEHACDTLEADASPDRKRLVMRRATSDTNRDGRVGDGDDAGLVAVDLARGLEVTIVQPSAQVNGCDWSALDDLVLYSGVGIDGPEDVWGIQANGRDNAALVSADGVRERRPRLNAQASAALYERIAQDGKAVIWRVTTGTSPATLGGTPGAALAGSPYVVGADTDAAFAPDGQRFVFRRLASTALAPHGAWDLMTMGFDGATPRLIVGDDGLHRGAPDWGRDGIVFPEFDGAQWRLVLVAPDGSNRRVLITLPAGQRLTSVRWLP